MTQSRIFVEVVKEVSRISILSFTIIIFYYNYIQSAVGTNMVCTMNKTNDILRMIKYVI